MAHGRFRLCHQRRGDVRVVGLIEHGDHGQADGLVQLGARLVGRVAGRRQVFHLAQHLRRVLWIAGQLAVQISFGELVQHQRGDVAAVSLGQGEFVRQSVFGHDQGAVVFARVDVPHQQGGEHVILGALAAGQHAVDPLRVIR
ncbi:hypothetical protein D3C81_1633160 [compost metagenome]